MIARSQRVSPIVIAAAFLFAVSPTAADPMWGALPDSVAPASPPSSGVTHRAGYHEKRVALKLIGIPHCEAKKKSGRWMFTGWCVLQDSGGKCSGTYVGFPYCPPGNLAGDIHQLCGTHVDLRTSC